MSTHIAKLLDKRPSKSGNTIVDYLPIIGPTGDFTRAYNFDVIVHSWDVILTTREGSYIDDPNFGSKLYQYVFEIVDESIQEEIREEIIDKLTTYDNRAKIRDVQVYQLQNKKGFSVEVSTEWEGQVNNYSYTMDESLAKIIAERQLVE